VTRLVPIALLLAIALSACSTDVMNCVNRHPFGPRAVCAPEVMP